MLWKSLAHLAPWPLCVEQERIKTVARQHCLRIVDWCRLLICICLPLCACSIVPLLPFYLSSWLSSFPCKHTLFKNMVNHSLLPQLAPPMARSVCKGRLVDRSDAGGTECTMVSSEPLCIQGLQGWTPCQFCIPRWCQNQYLDGQWYGEVWHLPGHSQLWIHHEVPQDDHLLLSAWKSDSRAGHYDSKMLIEDGDRSIHPRGSKHTSCGLCKATPWPVELLTKSCHFLWIVRLLCWSFAMTPFSFHLPELWRYFRLMRILACIDMCTKILGHHGQSLSGADPRRNSTTKAK